MPESTYRWASFATLSALAFGCAGKDRLFKVEGIVTLDGQPIAGAIVSFLPDERGGRAATGTTAADGSFRLTTYTKDDGALRGDYRVTVTLIPDDDDEDDVKGKEEAPTKDKAEDGKALMSAMVKMAAARQKALERSPIPAIYREGGRTPLRQMVPAEGKVVLALKRQPPQAKPAKNLESAKSAEPAPLPAERPERP